MIRPGVGAGPLVEVPVVGRPDHGPGQLRVAYPELVTLTGKAGQRGREADGGVDAVEVHVVHPGVDVVGAAAHLVEAGRIEGALMQRLAHDGVEPDLVVLLPVVEPVLRPSAVIDHHPGGPIGEALRHPPLEHVGWFDQMVVDRDQRHVSRLTWRLRQPVDRLGLGTGGQEPGPGLDVVETYGAGHVTLSSGSPRG